LGPWDQISNLEEKGSQGPTNEDFEIIKTTSPGIQPIYTCAKFQHDCAIF